MSDTGAVAVGGIATGARMRAPLPRPALLLAVLVVLYASLCLAFSPAAASQTTINGLVAGCYFGLGALGLTLIIGVLRVVNFAHGDMLTIGAYLTILLRRLGLPGLLAMAGAVVATALVALVAEKLIWRPLRRSGAGALQLFLSSIGLAFVLRYATQFFAGGQARSLGFDNLSSFALGPVRLGTQQAIGLAGGVALMIASALMLRFSALGKDMRAYADDPALAEVSGIATGRIIDIAWLFSGGLAGLAGLIYASAVGSVTPTFGVTLLLGLFASAVLGGIGNVYGALVGGMIIGLSQEWATLLVNARWKPAIGFAVLALTMLFLPDGIFGRPGRRT